LRTLIQPWPPNGPTTGSFPAQMHSWSWPIALESNSTPFWWAHLLMPSWKTPRLRFRSKKPQRQKQL